MKECIIGTFLKNLTSTPLCCPVLGLPLICLLSKVLEKFVFMQLQAFLQDSVLERIQSGFRSRHSTESALLRLHNDIAFSVEAGYPAMPVLFGPHSGF